MNKRDFLKSMFAGLGAAALPGAIVAGDFLPTDGYETIGQIEAIDSPIVSDGIRVFLNGQEIHGITNLSSCDSDVIEVTTLESVSRVYGPSSYGTFEINGLGGCPIVLFEAMQSASSYDLDIYVDNAKISSTAFVRYTSTNIHHTSGPTYSAEIRLSGPVLYSE